MHCNVFKLSRYIQNPGLAVGLQPIITWTHPLGGAVYLASLINNSFANAAHVTSTFQETGQLYAHSTSGNQDFLTPELKLETKVRELPTRAFSLFTLTTRPEALHI